jgi:ABC-type Zn uptake system ZnuABC Zn-binding protein ZnuA
MKKLLAIALIATSFVACNSGETKTEEKTTSDTATVVVPTADTVKTVTDTTVKTTTTVTPAKDTTKK